MFHIRFVTDKSQQFSHSIHLYAGSNNRRFTSPMDWYIVSCNVGMLHIWFSLHFTWCKLENTVQNRIYLCSGVDYIYMSHCDTMRCNNTNPTHRKYAPKLIVSAFVYVTNWNVMVCICSYEWIMVEWNEHEAVTCLHDGGYRNKNIKYGILNTDKNRCSSTKGHSCRKEIHGKSNRRCLPIMLHHDLTEFQSLNATLRHFAHLFRSLEKIYLCLLLPRITFHQHFSYWSRRIYSELMRN